MSAKKILMIDDDEDFVLATRLVLERAGYHLTSTGSIQNGLDLYAKVEPDLILLDVMINDISAGFRFAKELREMEERQGDSPVPVLMLTGIKGLTGMEFQKRMGTELLPVDGWIDKPVQPGVLLERIAVLIKLRNSSVMEE